MHLLNAHPHAKLTVYAIWLPMLAGDSRGASDAHVLDDPRVVSLWDGSQLAGRWSPTTRPAASAHRQPRRKATPSGTPTSPSARTPAGAASRAASLSRAATSSTTRADSSSTSSRSSRAAERPRAKWSAATIEAMDKPRRQQPNRLKRLIAFPRRRCEQTVPSSWLDEPPADPDIGVREPRRPRPHGSAGTVLLEP